jgi:hypothetical protein
MYLTKSDFKICYDCRTRLYYRKKGYPSATEENEYLRFLAEGGFMIEFIAKARYPGGIDLADIRSPEESATRTTELLGAGNCTLFEAGFIFQRYHVRTDIVRRVGNVLELIEVKSSSIEDDDDDATSPFLTKKGEPKVTARWRKYFLDLAFQAYVVGRAYPAYTVKPFLCVVNKSAIATEHETLGQFLLTKDATNPKARPVIAYAPGEERLRNCALVVTRPVEVEVATLMDEVIARAHELVGAFESDGVKKVREPLAEFYGKCRKCDYRIDGAKSGFTECWEGLAATQPHVLDLYRVTQIGSKEFPDPIPTLLNGNRAGLLDLREDQLGTNSYSARRRIQWRCLQDKTAEYLHPELRAQLLSHQTTSGWPIHFIDFEACDLSLPHHAGLRPFERVAFQWSCHTLDRSGALRHREWLNDQREFPNFAFVASLRACIGEEGTVYVWSWYEQTTLRKILEQILAWLTRDSARAVHLSGLTDEAAVRDLAAWIDRLLGPADSKGKRHQSPRIRDLHALGEEHYFHPAMGGRTSIKVVLPAIWSSNERIRNHACFAAYAGGDDPYAALPALPFGENEEAEEAVREGTGAIRVYQDLIFTTTTDADRQNRRRLLLQYCQLDTAAMVMIWAHWLGRYDFAPA